MSQRQVRQVLKEVYQIDFPDDLFQFWEFAQGFSTDNPLSAFWKPMGLRLEGPFSVLAGNSDAQPPDGWYLSTRYYDDPPEFFTVFSGNTDGLHWGYWFEDPDGSPDHCLADYYSSDAYEITEDGGTLFEAFRLQLEGCHESTLEYLEEDANVEQDRAAYETDLQSYALCRNRLVQYATGERTEIGKAYREKYLGISSRNVAAATSEGMGIVVPSHCYRPLSVSSGELRILTVQNADLSVLLAEADQALAEGFPGTALEFGKNLWVGNPAQKQEAYRLLGNAYTALNRPTLKALLDRIVPLRIK